MAIFGGARGGQWLKSPVLTRDARGLIFYEGEWGLSLFHSGNGVNGVKKDVVRENREGRFRNI
jgi:hypothetical protein